MLKRLLFSVSFVCVLMPISSLADQAVNLPDQVAEGAEEAKSENLTIENGKVVVSVNDKKITQSVIDNIARQYAASTGARIDQQTAQDEAIKQTVLAQHAEHSGLDKSQEFVTALEQQRDALLVSIYMRNQIEKLTPTNDQLLREYHNLIKEIPNTEYKVQYMVVESKALANTLIEKLETKPKNFSDLARQHSIDRSKSYGGDLGWVSKDQLESSIADVIEDFEVGSLSPRAIKNQKGWQIVFLQDQREKVKPSFDDLKQNLQRTLLMENLTSHVDRLVTNAKVEYHD